MKTSMEHKNLFNMDRPGSAGPGAERAGARRSGCAGEGRRGRQGGNAVAAGRCGAAAVVAVAALGAATPGASAAVIAFGDDWATSSRAFGLDNSQATRFAQNIADVMAPGGTGNFLILSNFVHVNNGGFSTLFIEAIESNGHTVSVNPAGFSLSVDTLSGFDGVFFTGTVGSGEANAEILSAYAKQGGSVFVMAGLGVFGTAAAEAAAWNPFLASFDLAFGDSWIGTTSTAQHLPVTHSDTVLGDGISGVAWRDGHEVIDLNPGDPRSRIALTGVDFSNFGSRPPNGVLNIAGVFAAIPAPGSAAVFGLAALAGLRRRRRAPLPFGWVDQPPERFPAEH